MLGGPPDGVPQIAREVFQRPKAPGVTGLLAKRERIAEAEACLACGFL